MCREIVHDDETVICGCARCWGPVESSYAATMRILIIEDESRIVAFVKSALKREGLIVDCAADGVSGLKVALANPYDLVVLDLMLPGMGGLAVLEQLRRAKPSLPVLIVSARSELPAKLRGFELGATDYLTKPFALDELVARVRVQLRRSGGDGATVTAGTLALDLVRRQVRLDGVVIDLSDREFGLLRHLIGGAGSAVSRDRLLADVWGLDFDPGTNVVDVCVRRLRRKLGPAAPIETVRNVGYRIPQD